MQQTTTWIGSIYYNLLVRTVGPGFGHPLWHRLWKAGHRWFVRPVESRIHGRPVRLPYGYPYPAYMRHFRRLNHPLVELAMLSAEALGRPMTFVDLGSAVGDTALLLSENCPGAFDRIVCVDGDAGFLELARWNLAHIKGVEFAEAMLAGSEGTAASLERHHAGSAASTGGQTVRTTTLDAVLARLGIRGVDLIKCDLDGFDGEALSGAASILRDSRPAVMFEWHPDLCARTGTPPALSFRILEAAGYDRFVWFVKTGEFSHFDHSPVDPASIGLLERFCRESHAHPDHHFDVAALHAGSRVDPVALAELRRSTSLRSPF